MNSIKEIFYIILIQCFTKAIPLCFLSLLPTKKLKNDKSIELQLFEDNQVKKIY